MRYLEDFQPGQVFEFHSEPQSKDQIKAFARKWDPQPFHIDEEFARTGPHGGLIASGFQTVLVIFEPVMRELMADVANIGGIGFNDLRWLRPFRPDESLDIRIEIQSVTPSRNKPDRGVMYYTLEAHNPSGETVLTVEVPVMIARRNEGEG